MTLNVYEPSTSAWNTNTFSRPAPPQLPLKPRVPSAVVPAIEVENGTMGPLASGVLAQNAFASSLHVSRQKDGPLPSSHCSGGSSLPSPQSWSIEAVTV